MILPDTEQPDSAAFWAATREKRLVVQRCDACGTLRFPPHPYCSACRSAAMSWKDVSGRGKLWSFSVMHKPVLPAFEDKAPFPVVVVELEENPTLRMTGNVIAKPGAAINSVDPARLKIGAPMQVSFEKVSDDVTLPYWTLVQS
jgi:uncharacterized OB-fold protein